jgi:hypothetical protein
MFRVEPECAYRGKVALRVKSRQSKPPLGASPSRRFCHRARPYGKKTGKPIPVTPPPPVEAARYSVVRSRALCSAYFHNVFVDLPRLRRHFRPMEC